MTRKERRRAPRASIRGPVKVFGPRTVSGSLKDISSGGLFVQTAPPLLPVGTEVTLRFALPDDPRELEASGEIRYHSHLPAFDGGAGFGLRFIRLPYEARARIDAFVQANWVPGHEPPFRE